MSHIIETLSPTKGNRILIPVVIKNPNTNKCLAVKDALIDTGATQSIISIDIAKALGISFAKAGETETAAGNVKSYLLKNIIMTFNSDIPVEFELDVQSLETIKKGHVVIGMDILKQGKICIERKLINGLDFLHMVFLVG